MMTDEDWMDLAGIYNKIMDVVIGYRNTAISGGFDTQMADHMAAQLHATMLHRFFSAPSVMQP